MVAWGLGNGLCPRTRRMWQEFMRMLPMVDRIDQGWMFLSYMISTNMAQLTQNISHQILKPGGEEIKKRVWQFWKWKYGDIILS
jgi:hypothetical protein